MSISLSLMSVLGKPVSDKLISALLKKKNGAQKLEEAGAAMAAGASAVDALKKAFGDDFLKSLTDAMSAGGIASFDYQAGVSNYMRIEGTPGGSPAQVLRDELNVNLDRVALMSGKELRNQFRYIGTVEQTRLRRHAFW